MNNNIINVDADLRARLAAATAAGGGTATWPILKALSDLTAATKARGGTATWPVVKPLGEQQIIHSACVI